MLVYEESVWKVFGTGSFKKVKCHLVKVEASDLEVGGTYFHSDQEEPDFTKLDLYCKFLGGKKSVNVRHEEDIYTCKNPWLHWFKVVPVRSENSQNGVESEE